MKAKILIKNGLRKDPTDPYADEILLCCKILQGSLDPNDRIITEYASIKISSIESTPFDDTFNLVIKKEDYQGVNIFKLYSHEFEVI